MKNTPSILTIAVAVLLISPIFAFRANADNGFWIRKGTSYGSPKRSITKTKITPQKKSIPKSKGTVGDAAPVVETPPVVDTAPVAETPQAVPAAQPASTASQAEAKQPLTQASGTRTPPSIAGDAASSNQSTDKEYVGVTFSDPVKQKWRVGVVLVTGRDAVKDVFTYIPIPKEWPEQSVAIFDEDIPVEFVVQKIDELDGLDRLILRGRVILPKKKIVALQTFIVTTHRVNAPPDTTVFSIPDSKQKLAKQYTSSGAEISFRNKELRKQAQELVQGEGTDWEKVERIFDWVRDNIDQGDQDPRGSIATFVKKTGHPEDVVGVFVALCRANSIPARMVFVDGSQYAEFLLADPNGQLHWFPCDVVGIRAFGKIVEPKVILQKGDNIRVPGIKGKKKFVAAYGEVKSLTAPQLMQFVREPLSD